MARSCAPDCGSPGCSSRSTRCCRRLALPIGSSSSAPAGAMSRRTAPVARSSCRRWQGERLAVPSWEVAVGVNEVVASYGAAWNETDESARRKLLEAAWADDGVYCDPTATVTGRDAL